MQYAATTRAPGQGGTRTAADDGLGAWGTAHGSLGGDRLGGSGVENSGGQDEDGPGSSPIQAHEVLRELHRMVGAMA